MESLAHPQLLCLVVLLFVSSSASNLTDLDKGVQEQGSRVRSQRHQSAAGIPDETRAVSLPAVGPDTGHSVGHRSVDATTLRKLLLLYNDNARKQRLEQQRRDKANAATETDRDAAAKSSRGEAGEGSKNDYSHYDDVGDGGLWEQTETDKDKREKVSEDEDLSALTFNIATELAEQKDLLEKLMKENDPRNQPQVMAGRGRKKWGRKSKGGRGKTRKPIPASRKFLQDAGKGKERKKWKGIPSLDVRYDVANGVPKQGSKETPKIFKIQEGDVPADKIGEESGDVMEDDHVPRTSPGIASEGRRFVGKAGGRQQPSRVAGDDSSHPGSGETSQVGDVVLKRLQQLPFGTVETAVSSDPPAWNVQLTEKPSEKEGEFRTSTTLGQASPSQEPEPQRETTPTTEAAPRLAPASLERNAWVSVDGGVSWPGETKTFAPLTTASERISLKSNSETSSERLTLKDDATATAITEQLPLKSDAVATSEQLPLKHDVTVTSVHQPMKSEPTIRSEQQPLTNDATITSKNLPLKNDATVTTEHLPLKNEATATRERQALISDSSKTNSSDAASLFSVFSLGGSQDAVKYAVMSGAAVGSVMLIVCCWLVMCRTRSCRRRRRQTLLQMTEESLTRLNTYPPLYVSLTPLRKSRRPGQHYLLSM